MNNDHDEGKYFWLGNAILAVALIILLNMDSLWRQFGPLAMGVWIVLAGVGAYFLTSKKGKAPKDRD